jgi:hypothetical protein
MMKKTIATLIVAGLSLTSGISYAADDTVTQIQSGVYVENDATGCSILRDRVTVNTSNGVTMAYNCITAANKVNIAGCHTAGSQKPSRVNCVAIGEDDEGNPIYNGEDCTAEGLTSTPIQQTDIEGRRVFIASTTGGSVGTSALNAEICTIGALTALPAISQ